MPVYCGAFALSIFCLCFFVVIEDLAATIFFYGYPYSLYYLYLCFAMALVRTTSGSMTMVISQCFMDAHGIILDSNLAILQSIFSWASFTEALSGFLQSWL